VLPSLQARRIRNKAIINEDPRTLTIRELRVEVAFLKKQLCVSQLSAQVQQHSNKDTTASASGHDEHGPNEDNVPASHKPLVSERCGWDSDHNRQPGEALASICSTEVGDVGSNCASTGQTVCNPSEQLPARQEVHNSQANSSGGPESHRNSAFSAGVHTLLQHVDASTGTGMEPIEEGLETGDLLTKELVDKIVRYAEVSKALKKSHDKLVDANSQLRGRFLTADQELTTLRTSMSTCEAENVELRELGTLLSSVVKVFESLVFLVHLCVLSARMRRDAEPPEAECPKSAPEYCACVSGG
jgi:hypothetical protein